MSTNAGQLLWNRQRITLAAGANSINTGLTQVNQGFALSSVAEPNLGIAGAAAPADGTEPPSRVMVIPLAPTDIWVTTPITHGEPWFNTATGTVFVTINNAGLAGLVVNILFWNPATAIGPGEADVYNA
jgi:hypothetical protein